MEVKKYILDFTECNYPFEVHEKIQLELDLPDWYGKNNDALWDAITGIMYLPAHIIIERSAHKKLEIMMDEIINIFQEAEKEEFITVEVK